MKLYKVYNGYAGNDSVYVLVVAMDELQAKRLASESFKRDALFDAKGRRRTKPLYGSDYWDFDRMDAVAYAGSLDAPWAGVPEGG